MIVVYTQHSEVVLYFCFEFRKKNLVKLHRKNCLAKTKLKISSNKLNFPNLQTDMYVKCAYTHLYKYTYIRTYKRLFYRTMDLGVFDMVDMITPSNSIRNTTLHYCC